MRKLMKVPIKDIEDNPFRDLEVHPIDAEQVESLTKSIDELGFPPGSIIGRAHPKRKGKYQLAYGHHRREAARKVGLKEIEIGLQDMDDHRMRRWLMVENATQRGHCAGAVYSTVMALHQEVGEMLAEMDPRDFSTFVEKWFDGTKGAEIAKGKYIASGLVGEPLIEVAAPHGTLTRRQIRHAVSALNESGNMAKISKGRDVITDPIFDLAGVLNVFETDSQIDAFREIVTSDAGRDAVKYDEQAALAEKVLADLQAAAKEKRVQVRRNTTPQMIREGTLRALNFAKDVRGSTPDYWGSAKQKITSLSTSLGKAMLLVDEGGAYIDPVELSDAVGECKRIIATLNKILKTQKTIVVNEQ